MKSIESAMNVNVSEHQRSILATMGIDLWVLKVAVQTRHYQTALYRDVEQEQQTSIDTIEFSNLSAAVQSAPNTDTVVESSIQIEKPQLPEVSLLKRNPETQRTEEVTTSKQIQQQTDFVAEPAVQLSPFEIQAYVIENSVLLIDSTQISSEQLTLWSNIQRALIGQFYELKWPFPMLAFQDGRGASLYVQGFIDALRQERKIISLGHISHVGQQEIVELASLQEMLEQPLLKRRLWQMMQNKGA